LIEELKRDFTLLLHEILCHINVTKEEDGKVKDINGIRHQGTIMRQNIIKYLMNQRKGSYQRMTLKRTKYGWMNNHIA
jgi:hypothetical protein